MYPQSSDSAESEALIDSAKQLPSLKDSYASLLKKRKTDAPFPESAYLDCLAAQTDSDADAVLCLKIAGQCLQDKAWLAAESLAMKSLIARPKTWAAYRILEHSLRGQGKTAEVQSCANKQFPAYLIKKYFCRGPADSIDSSENRTIAKIPARPSETCQLTSPKFMDENDNPAYQHSSITSKESYTAIIENGKLWFDGFNIVAWDKKDRMVSDVCAGYPELTHELRTKSELTTLNGTACFLGNRVASNYYHWMNDVIPRLGVLHDCQERRMAFTWRRSPILESRRTESTGSHTENMFKLINY